MYNDAVEDCHNALTNWVSNVKRLLDNYGFCMYLIMLLLSMPTFLLINNSVDGLMPLSPNGSLEISRVLGTRCV